MNHSKPTPLVPQPTPKTCPICGHSSYSPDGIHPQCAVTQADAPRKTQLDATKKAMAIEKQQAAEE
jgi:hypothetical protein